MDLVKKKMLMILQDLSNKLHPLQRDKENDYFLPNLLVSFLLIAPTLILKEGQSLSLDAIYCI